MIQIEKELDSDFTQAVMREGVVLSLCNDDGDVLVYLGRVDCKGLGDLSRQLRDGKSIIHTHTNLGEMFLRMWILDEL